MDVEGSDDRVHTTVSPAIYQLCVGETFPLNEISIDYRAVFFTQCLYGSVNNELHAWGPLVLEFVGFYVDFYFSLINLP